jgi:hypothetical protein
MQRFLRVILILLFINSILSAAGQPQYPQDYFQAPVDIKMLLSGTFGELRSNHFHSGIDIKTNGNSGEKILAIADGYVSRLKVSTWGFGNTLYITHPNGYVSVYAHLDRFSPGIAKWVKDKHYEKESFELNEFPAKNELTVEKGEVIGYSGSSGYSYGPHLHFEIREEANQKPLNPLLFGMDVKDNIRPKILAVRVYPFGEESLVEGNPEPETYKTKGWGIQYRLAGSDTVEVSGAYYLGIRTYDLLNDASNKNGVYSIDLLVNDTVVYSYRMDGYTFDETRYINSFIDYAELVNNRVRYQKSRREPNNRLSVYGELKNDGVIKMEGKGLHHIQYVVKDFMGNTSMVSFMVKSSETQKEKRYAISHEDEGIYFDHKLKNGFANEYVSFDAPAGAFYDSFVFLYDSVAPPAEAWSHLHKVHLNTMPVHTWCRLSIKPFDTMPAELYEKALLAEKNGNGEWSSAGGAYEKGVVSARVRDFGEYCVMIDTLAPEISPKQIKGMKTGDKIRFRIKDEFSGIDTYRGELNGKWVLMQYDAKNELLFYQIDERLLAGRNSFSLTVVDQKGNEAKYETTWVK